MGHFNKSIRYRSSLFLVILLAGSLTLLGGLTLNSVKSYQMAQMETDLSRRAKTVNLEFNQMMLSAEDSVSIEALLLRSASELLRLVTNDRALSTHIYSLDGHAYNDAEPLDKELLERVLDDQILYRVHDEYAEKSNIFVDYVSPIYGGEKIIGILRLKYYYGNYIAYYENIRQMIFVAGASVFVFSLLAALLYFGGLTSAISKLKQSVKRIEEGIYDDLEAVDRKDELGDLSRGIHQMAQKIDSTLKELHLEQEHLTLAVSKLKAMEEEQRHFFGRITHEFKTPLSVINAYNDLTEMYRDDEVLLLSTKQQIRDEVKKLTTMVENALELAKIEKYDFELSTEYIDLKVLIEQAVERLRVKAAKYDLNLSLELDAFQVWGDSDMWTQIFVNLLDNAIKYNYSGGYIWIELNCGESHELIIENTGQGVSEAIQDQIFEPFVSDDRTALTKETGTGLGLSLVKHLVSLQKGTIEISSGEKKNHSESLKGCRVVIKLS